MDKPNPMDHPDQDEIVNDVLLHMTECQAHIRACGEPTCESCQMLQRTVLCMVGLLELMGYEVYNKS